MRLHLLLCLLALLLLASCDRKGRMASVAEENIFLMADYPEGLVIKAVSEPDSAFGINYLSQHEVNSMAGLLKQVTEVIMERTKRQMHAMTELRDMIYKTHEKGEWSGWKLRVDYESDNGEGLKRRAERWFFFDKDGKTILRSFELPLP